MQESLEKAIADFMSKYKLGHLIDITDEHGRRVTLVSRPRGLRDLYRFLRGRYYPHVEEYYQTAPSTQK